MQKKSSCIVSLELYMEDFMPSSVYEVLGLRPSACKCKHAPSIVLSYRNWRSELEKYETFVRSLDSMESSTQELESNQAKIIEPPAFYKISSKPIGVRDFRKQCEQFVAKIDKKEKALLALKEHYGAFLVLKISIRHQNDIALSLTQRVSQVCARLGARIQIQINRPAQD